MQSRVIPQFIYIMKELTADATTVPVHSSLLLAFVKGLHGEQTAHGLMSATSILAAYRFRFATDEINNCNDDIYSATTLQSDRTRK